MLLNRTVTYNVTENKMVISALISLSTIGFGDMVPMVEPPLMYADAVRNESGMFEQISTLMFYPKILECFNVLVDPVPDTLISIENRLPKQCEDTTWPDDIEMTFNFYRVSVFFWILLGLVWLTGVVTIAVEGVKSKGKKFGFETRNATRKPTIQRLVLSVPS